MIEADKLFTGFRVEVLPSAQTAENGAIASYVLSQLPLDLAKVRDGEMSYSDLREVQSGVLREGEDEVLRNRDPSLAELMQLDMLFMLGGYLPNGVDTYRAAPKELLPLLEQNGEYFSLPRRMTYEHIIDLNSGEFLRTGVIRSFFPQESSTGLYERDFYVGHFMAETLVNGAYNAAKLIRDIPDLINQDETSALLLEKMSEFRRRMVNYARLPRSEFLALRPYLAQYPDGTRNASGALMPSVQQFELAMHPPTDEMLKYIAESMQYFPRLSQPVIKELVEQSVDGHNIADLRDCGDIDLSKDTVVNLRDAAEQFIQFKHSHMGTTKKHVPESFEGKVDKKKILEDRTELDILEEGETGTAGFNIQNILGNGVKRAANMRDRFEI